MKLALISIGIQNKSIENELRKLIGKDFKGLKILFCTTAAKYYSDEMNGWLIEDLEFFKKHDCEIDMCDINEGSLAHLLPRFERADVFYFGGGNTQWLRKCIKNSGLETHLEKLLETKVWIGISAGSCVLTPTTTNPVLNLAGETIEGYPSDGLNLVDFQFIPHLNSPSYCVFNEQNIRRESLKLTANDGKKLYALDDESALFIENGSVKVVSEGNWFEVDISCCETFYTT